MGLSVLKLGTKRIGCEAIDTGKLTPEKDLNGKTRLVRSAEAPATTLGSLKVHFLKCRYPA